MKKTLKLADLNVKSFKTADVKKEIKGGAFTYTGWDWNCHTDCNCPIGV